MRKASQADLAQLEDLVKKAQKGEKSAFGKLIDLTQNRLFRFCIYLSGDRAMAEDLAQETYLRAYGRIDGLTNPSSFQDWLFRIAKNLYIDHVRSGVSKETELDEAGLEAMGIEGSDVSEVLAVQKTLSSFEPDDRYLLLLVEVEGRTYKEAADLMEVTEDTVRSRLFRIRKIFLERWHGSETK